MTEVNASQTNIDAGKTEESANSEVIQSTPPKESAPTTGEQTPATQAPQSTEAEPSKETVKVDEVANVPEIYELKLPENSKLEQSELEQISAFAKENKLSNELAQKILDQKSETISNFEAKALEQHRAKADLWFDQIATDKVLGGDNFKKNAELAKRAAQRWGGEPFFKTLEETGFGNHPDLFRLLVNAGKEIGEDSFFEGSQTHSQPLSRAQRIFGNSKK